MRGGKRPGSGRKKGTPNKATTAKFQKLTEGGKMPLELMLAEMRNTKNPPEVRRAMAIAAAPYCHSRLAMTEAHVNANVTMTHEQALAELE